MLAPLERVVLPRVTLGGWKTKLKIASLGNRAGFEQKWPLLYIVAPPGVRREGGGPVHPAVWSAASLGAFVTLYQGCSRGLTTLEVVEDAWQVVGWDLGGACVCVCPHPWCGCCWKALSLCQDPSRIMLWVMSCWLGSHGHLACGSPLITCFSCTSSWLTRSHSSQQQKLMVAQRVTLCSGSWHGLGGLIPHPTQILAQSSPWYRAVNTFSVKWNPLVSTYAGGCAGEYLPTLCG